MTEIKDGQPNLRVPEERLDFQLGAKGATMIVVSGYQWCWVGGNPDDEHYSAAEVHLQIGPYCREIMRASPLATVATVDHPESDSDDVSGWYVENCPWDIASGLEGVPPDFQRVELKPVVGAKGEHARLVSLGYHAVIEAQELIDILKPGPAHS